MVQRLAASRSKKTNTKSAGGRGKDAALARQQHEITGVILIALGVLVGAYMFFSANGYLGDVLLLVLFGMFGALAYALPVIFIGLGILSIMGGKNTNLRGTLWLVVLGVLALITLMHIRRGADYMAMEYMPYLRNAYDLGTLSRLGGGFFGAALCYPLQRLGGNALAYILTITVIFISFAAVTGLSLRDVSVKMGESVQTAVQNVQAAYEERNDPERKLFTLDLDGDDTLLPPAKKPKAKTKTVAARGASGTGKKVSKKKKEKMLSDVDELVSILPLNEALPAGGGRRKPARVERVVTDIWDTLEPVVDVPPVIQPVRGAAVAEAPPLPDTSTLFGAQPPEPKITVKKAKQSAEKELKPSGAAAAKPIRVGKKAAEPDDITGIRFTNAPAYEPPPFTLLMAADEQFSKSRDITAEKAQKLIETLAHFHISAKVTNISVGPVLTRYELQPAPGVRVSRITSLSDDIALALAAKRVRIEAPIPGKSALGIEIPNENTATVVLRDIIESKEFQSAKSPITMALGKDISGKTVVADLGKMPHMLIAGATGSGKSVCLSDIIISMIYKSSPDDLKLILIDPKRVELSVYAPLPHLLIPIVTDLKKAANALRWAVNEMDQRYKKLDDCGARELSRYNELVGPEKRLPKLVVIIDEFSELMMAAPRDVEDYICRIAQLGRAAGVHLIVATQRPSVNVITGTIKANIPSRCAFAVSSAVDSRIILDAAGAEKLLGNGDMLYHPNGSGKPARMQCAFVSDEEVERIAAFFRSRALTPVYDEAVIADMANDKPEGGAVGGAYGEGKQDDELLGQAVRACLENGVASTSLLQRRLRVGYTRGSRLIDIMEEHGYVSPFEGSKPRKLLITREQYANDFNDPIPIEDKKATAQ